MSDQTAPAAPAAAVATSAPSGPVPFERFDLKAHMAKMLPSPSSAAAQPATEAPNVETPPAVVDEKGPKVTRAEAKSDDGASEEPKADAKTDETPEAKTITARMAALDRKQRTHDETLKRIAAETADLSKYRDVKAAVEKDPLAYLAGLGVDVNKLVLDAIADEAAKTGNQAKEEPKKPEAKAEDSKKEPETSEAELRQRGLDFTAELATKLGQKADLVMVGEKDGLLLDGKKPRDWAIDEVQRRFERAVRRGHIDGPMTRDKYGELMSEVLEDINDTFAKDADLVAKVRKPAPVKAETEEKETPAATTSAMGGDASPKPAFTNDAEFRDWLAKRREAAPPFKRPGRFHG